MMLAPNEVYAIILELFPAQNDCYPTDYVEEHNELLHFGTDTKEKFEGLIKQHKVRILEIDREP